MIYGTTVGGGEYQRGTVFSSTTNGKEKLPYSFSNSDGNGPRGGLVDLNGTLYGTTTGGPGSLGDGTVFSVTTSGTESVLHSFAGYPTDGAYPQATLVDVNGTLYGTTEGGGTDCLTFSGCGTVFSITKSGSERVLYSFKGGKDGEFPWASLIDVNGTLYGTTAQGGTDTFGTVFSITTSGKEKVLHSFGFSGDGNYPYASLIDVNGTLYGTTAYGGANDDGTVFSVSTKGKELVLFSFDATDGEMPNAGLVDVNGTLYGTTLAGGAYCTVSSDGCGTLFSVTTAGAENVLHSFGKGKDGTHPYAGLVDLNGTLYGTTETGGKYEHGGSPPDDGGTLFALTP
jgi:uncharacterized repeat protein (TIGR03803 family)